MGLRLLGLIYKAIKLILSERYWIFRDRNNDGTEVAKIIEDMDAEFVSFSRMMYVAFLKRRIVLWSKNTRGDKFYFRYRSSFSFLKMSGYYLKCKFNKREKTWHCEEKISEPGRSFLVLYSAICVLFFLSTPFFMILVETERELSAVDFLMYFVTFIMPIFLLFIVNLFCRYIFWKSREQRSVLQSMVLSKLQN